MGQRALGVGEGLGGGGRLRPTGALVLGGSAHGREVCVGFVHGSGLPCAAARSSHLPLETITPRNARQARRVTCWEGRGCNGPRRRFPSRPLDGVAELANRLRGLSQRHRTVLLLVDGQRRMSQILATAQAAGVQVAVFEELLTMGLVELPPIAAHRPATRGQPGGRFVAAAVGAVAAARVELVHPATDSMVAIDRPAGRGARAADARAARSEAPLAGTLHVDEAASAPPRVTSVEALLDEVEQRLRKPHRHVIAAQTLRHVRHLLTLPGLIIADGGAERAGATRA